jgi:hypothetical protein
MEVELGATVDIDAVEVQVAHPYEAKKNLNP